MVSANLFQMKGAQRMSRKTTPAKQTAQQRESVVRRIAGAALPLYLTMIASSAGALVDTAVLGQHTTSSLAAFTVAMAVFTPSTAAVNGVMRGVMPFVAAHDDDPDALLPTVRNGTWLAMVVGAVAAVAVLGVPLLGAWTGVPREVLDELGWFPALLACSLVCTALASSATSVLVGLGRGKLVMRAGLWGTGTAVLLSLLLVPGAGPLPSLGLVGAGVAILASNIITAGVAQLSLHRSTVLAGHSLNPGRPVPREMLALAKVGVPLAGTVLIKFAVLGVLGFAAARLGAETAAVHSICISLANLVFTAAVAIGQATVPTVAGHVRDGDVQGVRRGVMAGLQVAVVAIGTLGAVIAVLHDLIIPVFTDDQRLQERVAGMLAILLVVVMADAVQAVCGFGLISIRRTMPSLVTFAVCYGVLSLVSVPTADVGGLTGLWLALAGANLLLILGQALSFQRHSGRLRPASATPAG
ncbi:Multidrug-efflux transporter [Streptomyces chartreusis NRRL 3882]|uniref:Probable multidrug resistance protein NorM n=2 Tax=Streptomyces TaxID=1883 RepID=A0A2N9BL24_STRCX|nr:Multidrug-efflux transporter [Streptomyces chartreusis NRRL 3882]